MKGEKRTRSSLVRCAKWLAQTPMVERNHKRLELPAAMRWLQEWLYGPLIAQFKNSGTLCWKEWNAAYTTAQQAQGDQQDGKPKKAQG